MKKLLLILAMLGAANAQYMVVTASGCIGDGAGSLLANGVLTVVGTDQNNHPIPYRAGSASQSTIFPITRGIVAGSLSASLQLADPATTSPTNVRYHFTIQDNITKRITDYPLIMLVANDVFSGGGFTQFNICKMNPLPNTTSIMTPTVSVTNNATEAITGDFSVAGTTTLKTLKLHGTQGVDSGSTPTGPFIIENVGSTTLALTAGISTTTTANGWIQARDTASTTKYNLALEPQGGRLMIGTNTVNNSLNNLFGTSSTSRTPALENIAGPFLSFIDAGNSVNSGGGLIFCSNSTQCGAGIKYSLQNGASNSQGDIVLLTRHAAADANPRQVLASTSGGITIGPPPGTAGGGINGDGGGFKHIRVTSCTTAAGANAVCSTTVTWPTAFVDANYTPNCLLSNPTSSGASVTHINGTQTAASISVEITNGTGGAITSGTLNCQAVHDLD